MANSNTINFNNVLVTGTLSMNSQTVTSSTPILSLAQTWNSGAVTFTGVLLNVTNTASAAGSLLIDLQVGGVSQFSVSRAGVMTIAGTFTASQFSATTGTITASSPAYSGTQTWNSAGITFTGILLNITDTASAAASLLLDLQVGSATVFNIGKLGNTTTTINALSTTVTTGLLLTNTTAAAVGAQQNSPAIVWLGNGWKTTATAASQTVEFKAWVVPVQGSAAPTANWILGASIAGGVTGTMLTIQSSGTLVAGQNIQAASNFIGASGSAYTFSTRSRITSPADSQVLLQNAAANDFSLLQIGGTTSSFPALKRASTTLTHRLADDSADGPMQASKANLTANNAIVLTNQTDGAGASAGTLGNAPSIGNPSFWLPVTINGNNRFIPCWT